MGRCQWAAGFCLFSFFATMIGKKKTPNKSLCRSWYMLSRIACNTVWFSEMQSTTLITLVPRRIEETLFILGTRSMEIAANCTLFPVMSLIVFSLQRPTERLPKVSWASFFLLQSQATCNRRGQQIKATRIWLKLSWTMLEEKRHDVWRTKLQSQRQEYMYYIHALWYDMSISVHLQRECLRGKTLLSLASRLCFQSNYTDPIITQQEKKDFINWVNWMISLLLLLPASAEIQGFGFFFYSLIRRRDLSWWCI